MRAGQQAPVLGVARVLHGFPPVVVNLLRLSPGFENALVELCRGNHALHDASAREQDIVLLLRANGMRENRFALGGVDLAGIEMQVTAIHMHITEAPTVAM